MAGSRLAQCQGPVGAPAARTPAGRPPLLLRRLMGPPGSPVTQSGAALPAEGPLASVARRMHAYVRFRPIADIHSGDRLAVALAQR